VLIGFHVENSGPVVGRVTLFTDDPDRRDLLLRVSATGVISSQARDPVMPNPAQPKAIEPRL